MLLKLLDRLEEMLIATLMAAATIIIFVAVAHRYSLTGVATLFNYGRAHDIGWITELGRFGFTWLRSINLTWAQELCIYLFVWMAKFGAAYGVRTGIHVGVDVLVNRLSAGPRHKVIIFALLCGALFTVDRRHARRPLRVGDGRHRPGLGRPRSADVDRLSVRAARLLSDVLPLPAGGVAVLAHRRAADARSRPRRGPRRARARVHRRRRDAGAEAMSVALIFGLLLALMLTGMPVSISLGLTVLTFLFTLTEVPIESVALKLFTGIEKFEIMAIPFFILAGNFLTHGGVARRMINFATSMVGHWYGGLGLAGVMACALFAAVSGSSPATVVAIGSIILPAMVQAGLSAAVRRRRHRHLRRARHPDPALDRDGDVCGGHRRHGGDGPAGERVTSASVGQLFMAGVIPGLMLASLLGLTTCVPRLEVRPTAHAEGELGRALEGVPRGHLGADADRDRDRRHLHRRLHADRGRRDERGLRLHRRGVRLSRHEALGRAEGAARLGQHDGHAALHHHQRGAVLVPDDAREHPADHGGVDRRHRGGLDRLPARSSTSCCCSPAT